MDFIDNYAYSNRLRRTDPAYKFGFVGTILLICLFSNSPIVGLATILWVWVLGITLAGIPAGIFSKILLAEFSFFLLATAGVAVSITLVSPLSQNPWAYHLGPFWFSTGPESLQNALLIISRVMGSVTAMNFLALTTPSIDLIDLFHRMHVPKTIIDLMTIIYRYIFVLLETMQTMRTSQESRLGYRGFKRGISSAGLLASRLFIVSYQRSQKLQTALESRGYVNDLRVLPIRYQTDWRFTLLGTAVLISLLSVWRFS